MTADRDAVDCAQILQDLERFLDGEVGAEYIDAMSAHIAECYPCKGRADFEHELRRLVRSTCREETPPPGLVDRIRLRLDEMSGDE